MVSNIHNERITELHVTIRKAVCGKSTVGRRTCDIELREIVRIQVLFCVAKSACWISNVGAIQCDRAIHAIQLIIDELDLNRLAKIRIRNLRKGFSILD